MGFCELLNEAVEDEEKAKEFYKKLKMSVDRDYVFYLEPELKKVVKASINEVSETEKAHSELFKKLRKTLCMRKG